MEDTPTRAGSPHDSEKVKADLTGRSDLALHKTQTHEHVAARTSRDSSAVPSESGSDGFNPTWRFKLAVGSLMVITLMAALDATSLSVALPTIARALNGSAIEAFWAGTSFLLTQTVFQPVLGALSQIFGRKAMIYGSLALFGVGAIVAAVAKDFTVMLAGRSVQGIGGGGVIALTEIVMTDLVPLKERGKWFSAISSMWALGTVTGPLLGGGFANSGADSSTWRWIFWINLPIIGIAIPIITLFLKLNYRVEAFWQKLKRIDFIGSFLFIGSTTGFIIPITWGGVMYSWDSWRTLVPLIVCLFGIVAFIVYEEWLYRKGGEPMVIFSPLKSVSGAALYFGTIIHGIILWCLLYYIPLYFEGVKGYSPIITGIAVFPETFTVAPASIVAGVFISITGRYRIVVWIGWFFATLGLGLLCILEPGTSIPGWIFLNLPFGIGTGILFSAMAIGTQASAPAKDAAYAAVLFSFLRSVGNTIGVAIGGVIFQNQMKKRLLDIPDLAARADEYAKDASALVQVLKSMPAGSPEKIQLATAYVDALRWVWIIMCILSGVAFIANLFIKQYSIERQLETEHGFNGEKKVKDAERL